MPLLRRAIAMTIVLAILVAGVVATRRAHAQQTQAAPRLVVLLVMDQFRGDYVDWYSQQWTKGLRRLIDRGAVFPRAAYPYAGTVTCAGHFTIGTGTLPRTHGMVWNAWYDRTTRRSVACVSDPTVTSVPFGGGAGREAHSPAHSRAPAFADLLREHGGPATQVVSVALKPRSAIGLGGHPSPSTVIVWEEDHGVWATSSAYTQTPWRDVDEFARAHQISADYGKLWTKLLPPDRYLNEDDAAGENTPGTWTRVFPHRLESVSGQPDNAYTSSWERSPYSDAYLLDFALHLAQSRKLGRGDRTDLLAVSLPSLDLVGHEYGPRSHEVQDVLARADVGIGKFLDGLDALVGRDRYVLAFSADHGVSNVPEQARQDGTDAGRISGTALRAAANKAISTALGEGSWVGASSDPNISLTPGTYDRLRAVDGAVESVRAALAAIPGIERVFTADELAATTPTEDVVLARWRMSYVAGRSGDFIASPKTNWIFRTAGGTTHGSPSPTDSRVPVMLFGAGIRAGRYDTTASPVDIVPTLAHIAGVPMAKTDGRVLTEAIVR